MKLYLVQHGDAVDKEIDPERPLNEVGRRKVEAVAAFAQRAGVWAPAVWHSGKARAAQTAEILAKRIAQGVRIEMHPGLNPNDAVEPICRILKDREPDLVIAGHLPHLSKLAARLLLGKEAPEPIAFQRGGIVALERGEESVWKLIWALPPAFAARDFTTAG